jgi:hypothetical protein
MQLSLCRLVHKKNIIQGNLGLTNLKGPRIVFFIAGVLLLEGLFTINLTTEGLEIKFFIAGISVYGSIHGIPSLSAAKISPKLIMLAT